MNQIHRFVLLLILLVGVSGCAKGALWRLGYLSPRVRQQWADEENYAKTWPTMKAEMTALVDRANLSGDADQQRAAGQLRRLLEDDRRVMVRLHATELLGKLPPAPAELALETAAQDSEADVRTAACRVMGQHQTPDSLRSLQRVLGSDTNDDVRIAAVRAIGEFSSPEAAKCLQLALESEQPALQLCAADSLGKISGQSYGRDIPKWQEYIAQLDTDRSEASASPIEQVSHQESGVWAKLFRR